jgi:hypothetical protein
MRGFLVIVMILSLGCAAKTMQVDHLLRTPLGIPEKQEIAGVFFVEQKAGHCGPATLAMTMAWAGNPTDINSIVSQVYTPGMQGSLQTDMISASRRNGMIAIPIKGFSSLMTEIANGNPVIVFENLSVSWLPQWHYAVVFGYDLREETILMHSGPESFKRWDLRKFERSWQLGDYWGLLVLPAGKLSVTANELDHLKAAAALEQVGKNREAGISYQSILSRWPHSLGALIGTANIYYASQDYTKSVAALTLATKYHPQSSAAWHNLSVAQLALGQKKKSQMSAQKSQSLSSAN